MKTLCTILLTALFIWSAPLSAKYCKTDDAGNTRSCSYSAIGSPDKTQIIVSYTQQGWSMMFAVFVEEFVLIEGDAKFQVDKGEIRTLKHVNTHRDLTTDGLLMEAPIYSIDEALLHEIKNSGGKVRFWLTATESKDIEIDVWTRKFSKLDEYIAETKATLGL